MSGLGIVLEEAERSPHLRSTPLESVKPDASSALAPISPSLHKADETLLPPLPEPGLEDDLAALGAPSRPSLAALSTSSSMGTAPLLTPTNSTSTTVLGNHNGPASGTHTYEHDHTAENENIFIVPESYALDSSALSIDTPPIAFPSIESHSTSALSLSLAPSLVPSTEKNGPSTSPLRRLKSIKNGIRKLSLSRMGSSTSIVSPHSTQDLPSSLQFASNTMVGARPLYSPSNSESFANDNCSSSSGGDSIKSTFSGTGNSGSFANFGSGTFGFGMSTTASTPQAPTHGHTSSSGSNGSFTIPKTRRRTLSISNSAATSATPPLPSPVVTVSENLASTKKNLASIEQSFFENWGPNAGNSDSSVHGQASTLSGTNGTQNSQVPDSITGSLDDATDKISILNTPDDLLEYSTYLSQHKKSVESAYDVSKNRLINSGWCSSHDIENLNLQRDSSVSQIDSKLLQIEAKLNSDFNISFLNNKQMQPSSPRQKFSAREALSPSLKDLENKCLFFSAEHGNIC